MSRHKSKSIEQLIFKAFQENITELDINPIIIGPLFEKNLILKALQAEKELKGITLYHNLTHKIPDDEAGPRVGFVAQYGLEDTEQERILITDRKEIANKRAKFHYEQGCDTANDFKILIKLGPEAYKHHTSPILDYWFVKDNEEEHSIIAEKYFISYKTLNSLLPLFKENPITKKEFETISSHVLDSLGYMDEKGIYHRDRSLRNIITNIRTDNLENKELEAIVIDCANACKKNHTKIKPQPTLGAKQITDPLMVSKISGKEKAYDDKAEVYAAAKDFLEILVGEKLLEIDQLEGTAIVTDNQFTSGFDLFENGKFRSDQYNALIDTAISNLPRHARKYAPILRRALSLDEKQRYSSTREFIREWHKHSNKDFAGTMKKIGLWTMTGIMLATGGYTVDSIFNKKIPMDIYQVQSRWNEDTRGIDNNYFWINTTMFNNKGTVDNPNIYFAKRGDDIDLIVASYYQAIDKKFEAYPVWFKGRAYIEGKSERNSNDKIDNFNFEEFNINPVNPGAWAEQGDLGNSRSLYHIIRIPDDAQEGSVYNLVVELFPTADTVKSDGWNSETAEMNKNAAIVFKNKKEAVYVKRIPIVIEGNEKRGGIWKWKDDKFGVTISEGLAKVGYSNDMVKFEGTRSDEKWASMDTNTQYLIRIPELDYVRKSIKNDSRTSNMIDYRLDLPDSINLKQFTLQTISYKNGQILNQSFFSVKRTNNKYERYVMSAPDTSFFSRTSQYAKDAEKLIK